MVIRERCSGDGGRPPFTRKLFLVILTTTKNLDENTLKAKRTSGLCTVVNEYHYKDDDNGEQLQNQSFNSGGPRSITHNFLLVPLYIQNIIKQ